MIKNSGVIIAITAIILSAFSLSWAYHAVVHSRISEETVKSSRLGSVLENQLGVEERADAEFKKGRETKPIWKWIADGAEAEDNGRFGRYDVLTTRGFNHFHDPLEDWDEAGLYHLVDQIYWRNYLRYPVSSILWGLNPGEQDFLLNSTGDWSWGKARSSLYNALTASNKVEREENFADCFRALGQVMHLLQDASVPLHTRNDLHLFPFSLGIEIGRWTYETYAQENRRSLNYSPHPPNPVLLSDRNPQSNYDHLVPVTGLFDRNQYEYDQGDPPLPSNNDIIGLAEYSNANFLTAHTMWTYPHPSVDDTNYDTIDWVNPEPVLAEDGEVDNRIYIRFKDGVGEQEIKHLAAADYWSFEYQGYVYNVPSAFSLDKECWKDYASELVPRAVGYSAGLLDYFFRGTMDIGDFSYYRDDSDNIIGLYLSVKNTTKLGEEAEPMEGGSLALSFQYTVSGQDEPIFGLIENIYEVAEANDPINSDYVQIDFLFSPSIPSTASDLTWTLIYRGSLGQEDGAVVAKVLPQFTSRIAFVFQPGGPGNVSNIYTIRPDGTDEVQITDTSDGYLYDFDPTWSPDGKMLAFYYDDPLNSDIIVIDMTSDEPYPDNILKILDSGDGWHDYFPSFSPDGKKVVAVRSGDSSGDSLITFDIATGTWEPIPNSASEWISGTPKWSPQGDRIVYEVGWSDPGIYVISPDGTGKVNLTDDAYSNYHPDWSPDGEWIAFVSDRDGGTFLDLWIMDRTGGNMQQIAAWDVSVYGPSFSPDGHRIVFDTLGDLYSVNLDASGLIGLTEKGYFTGGADWSPLVFPPED